MIVLGESLARLRPCPTRLVRSAMCGLGDAQPVIRVRGGQTDAAVRRSRWREQREVPLTTGERCLELPGGCLKPGKADAPEILSGGVQQFHRPFSARHLDRRRLRQHIGEPGAGRGKHPGGRHGHRLEGLGRGRDHGDPTLKLVRVTEQNSALEEDFGGQERVREACGEAVGFIEKPEGLRGVREPKQSAQAKQETGALQILIVVMGEEICGGAQTLGRGKPGVGALGPVGGVYQPLHGTRIAGLLQVIGDRVGIGLRASQKCLRDPLVPEPAARREHAFVERLAGEGMDEANAGAIAFGRQEMEIHGLLDDRQERLFVKAGDCTPEGEWDFLANHRGNRQRLAHVFAQPSHPNVDDLPE
jgi:hypothetical protein